jgi:hypothetical protein
MRRLLLSVPALGLLLATLAGCNHTGGCCDCEIPGHQLNYVHCDTGAAAVVAPVAPIAPSAAVTPSAVTAPAALPAGPAEPAAEKMSDK